MLSSNMDRIDGAAAVSHDLDPWRPCQQFRDALAKQGMVIDDGGADRICHPSLPRCTLARLGRAPTGVDRTPISSSSLLGRNRGSGGPSANNRTVPMLRSVSVWER